MSKTPWPTSTRFLTSNVPLRHLFVTALWIATSACGDDASSTATTGSGGAGTGGAGSGGGDAGVLTLDNCDTNIASDVPAFFQTYFRCVDITLDAGAVVIATRSLPPHLSYYYGEGHPNFTAFDASGGKMPNPNVLASQDIVVRVPVTPTARGITVDATLVDGVAQTNSLEYSGGPVGVALDSVAIFNAVAAPGMLLSEESATFDGYGAHPQMTGAYHYHGPSAGPLEVLERAGLIADPTPGSADIEVYGVMCDGTVVLGCTELDGSAPSAGDFDAQNGHVHDVSDGQTVHFAGRYHTHACGSLGTHAYVPEIQFYEDCAVD